MKRLMYLFLLVACVLVMTVDTGRAAAGSIFGSESVAAAAAPRPRVDFSPAEGVTELNALAPEDATRRVVPAARGTASAAAGDPTLFAFDRRRVGVFLPAQASGATIRYERNAARLAGGEESALFSFTLEVKRESAGTAPEGMRLMVDLRSLLPEGPPAGSAFYLSYQSTEDPALWIDVPVTVHDSSGLISADVMPATRWETGLAPERWAPSFSFPGVSGYSGAATYAYDIPLPEGRNGLAPPLSLRYSSRALDGRIRSSDSVPAVADGWSLNVPAIVRDGVRMARNAANQPASIMPDRYRLRLDGVGYLLREVGTGRYGGTRFVAVGAPHLYIERHDRSVDETRQRFFWTVITGEGVMYRLGFLSESEAYHETSHQVHLLFEPDDLPYRMAGVAWGVDLVVDPLGNQIRYEYLTRSDEELLSWIEPGGGEVQAPYAVHGYRLLAIHYNYPSIPSAFPDDAWPAPPAPDEEAGVSVLFRASSDDDLTAGTYENGIDRIYLFDGGYDRPLKEYRLDVVRETLNGACDTNTRTRVVRSIQQWANTDADPATDDVQNDGAYALPATTLTHTSLPHYENGCFSYRYLSAVDNGYGGGVRFTYQDDGRTVGIYEHTPIYRIWPKIGFSYVVTEKEVHDGHNPPARTSFAYQRPCYQQQYGIDDSDYEGARGCDSETYVTDAGALLGFDTVTVITFDFQGRSTGRSKTRFAQSNPAYQQRELLRGVPLRQEERDANGHLIQILETTYEEVVDPFGTHFFVPRRRTERLRDPANGQTMTLKTEARHLPALQGGLQLGNQTVSIDHGNVRVRGDELTTVRCFFPNVGPDRWIVTLPGVERVFAGALPGSRLGAEVCAATYRADDLVQERRILYDGRGAANPYGNAFMQPPQRALVTQAVSGVPGGEAAGTVNGLLAGERVTHDSFGNVIEIAAPGGAVTEVEYDATYHLFPLTITRRGTNLPQLRTSFALYGINGTRRSRNGLLMPLGILAMMRDPNGLESHYEYDPFGRLFAMYDSGADRGVLWSAWDGNPRQRFRYWDNAWNHGTQQTNPVAIATETRPAAFSDGQGGSLLSDVTYYDGLGRVVQTRRRNVAVDGHDRDVIVLQDYDAAGRQVCQSAPFDVAVSGDLVTTSCGEVDHAQRQYDAQGRLWREVTSGGSVTEHRYEVSLLGFTHHRIDANGHRQSVTYDGRNQIASVQTYSGACQAGWGFPCEEGEAPWSLYAETRYTYTPLGKLQSVIDAQRNVTTVEYDALQRRTMLDDPDIGRWNYGYDDVGRPSWRRSARGHLLCTAYDAYDRPVRQWQSLSNSCGQNERSNIWTATYQYDVQADGKPALGLRTRTSWAPDGAENYEAVLYDERLRPLIQRRVIDGEKYELKVLAYDGLDRPVTIRYPGGELVSFGYDNRGPRSLAVGDYTIVADAQTNVHGQLTGLQFSGGLRSNYRYASAAGDFRLSQIEVVRDRVSLLDLRYEYDGVGNVTQLDEIGRRESSFGFGFNGKEGGERLDRQTFGYDHLNRLVEAGGDREGFAYAHTYEYDVLGNITAISDEFQRTTAPYHYGAEQPHAVNSIGDNQFAYDANGNMTLRVEDDVRYQQYYDAYDRLISVRKSEELETSVTTFAYADGAQRVKRVENGRVTHYPFPSVTVRDPGTEQEVMETTIAFQGWAVAVVVQGGPHDGIYQIHTDHLGSAQLLTFGPGHRSLYGDPLGMPVNGTMARYLPFGERRIVPEVSLAEEGFTGHRQDSGLGLVYMNARYYVPGVGRFATADAMVAEPLDGQSLNRYSYVRNNPLRFVDPAGQCATVSVFDGTRMVEQPDPEDGACWEQYNYLRYEVGLSEEQIGLGHEYEARAMDEFAIMRSLYEQHGISWTTLLARSWRIADDIPAGGNCLVPGICVMGYSVLTLDFNGADWTVQSRAAGSAWETVYELRSLDQKAYVLESDAASYIEMIDAGRRHLGLAFEHWLFQVGSTIATIILTFVGLAMVPSGPAVIPFVGLLLGTLGSVAYHHYKTITNLADALGYARSARNEFHTLTRIGPDYEWPPAFSTVP